MKKFFSKKLTIGKVLLLELAVVVLVFLLNLMLCGQNPVRMTVLYFFDVPSLLLIVLLTIPALGASGLWSDFWKMFLLGKRDYSLRELKRGLEAVQLVQHLIICSAGIACVVAVVMVLVNLTELSMLGPNLAVAVLVIFYAMNLEFFLVILKANVQNAITDLMAVEDEEA